MKTVETISTPLPNSAPLLPLGSSAQWKEAHQSLSYHLCRPSNFWNKALVVAELLKTQLKALFPILDELCINTCPRCPEPCCLRAKIWFDFKDLLFLHLARKPVPLNPPLAALDDTCRYSGHKGCMLPRSSRPWICTWYLCPAQTAILRKRDSLQYKVFNQIVSEIKELRELLEAEFIKVVA